MADVSPRRRICKIGGYTRDRRGCLTCRGRKKKCSGPLGTHQCGQCNRLNLKCIWESERRVVPVTPPVPDECIGLQAAYDGPSSGQRQALVSLPPLQQGLNPWPGSSESAHRREAMRYYVQDLAGILSTTAENNGFLSVLLPMAMESRPVQDALIAWSTSHLAMKQSSMSIKALEDRNMALRSFGAGLHDLEPDIVIAICLILTSMEAILGNTDSWYHHLSAAAGVIRITLVQRDECLTSSLASSVEGRWLLRNFAYHDILASVSLGCDLLIPGLQWRTEDEVVDTYLGLGSAPMALLGEINSLGRPFTNETDDQASDADAIRDTKDRIKQIEETLLQWHAGSSTGNPLGALAESYRSATLIHLYRTIRSHELSASEDFEHKIAHQVETIVQCMTQMPVGCLPECTLLFPMFMAGGETHDVEHQTAIKARMETIAQERQFANVSAALDVLKEVWSERYRTACIETSPSYDWHGVLKRRKWSLALS